MSLEFVKPLWSFWDFFYFSVITLTTVGYGDILPNSTYVRMIVISEILVGSILLIVVLNAVTSRNSHDSRQNNARAIKCDQCGNQMRFNLRIPFLWKEYSCNRCYRGLLIYTKKTDGLNSFHYGTRNEIMKEKNSTVGEIVIKSISRLSWGKKWHTSDSKSTENKRYRVKWGTLLRISKLLVHRKNGHSSSDCYGFDKKGFFIRLFKTYKMYKCKIYSRIVRKR